MIRTFLRRREFREPAKRGIAKDRPSKPDPLKPEYERLVAGDVSQSLAIRPVKELISQAKPTVQLRWGLRYRARPSVAGQTSFDFSEGRVLPQRKQRDSRAFGDC